MTVLADRKLQKSLPASDLPKRHCEAVKGKPGPSFPFRRIATTLPNSSSRPAM